MDVQLWQIVIVVLYGFFINYDKNGTMIGTSQPVTAGLIVGLVLGDLQTGLYIGGTLQLMTLGISSFGGASVPDYQTASLVGTYVAITTGQSASLGITLAIPVAMLMVQLDVLKWVTNIYLQNKAEKFADEGKFKKIEWMHLLGVFNTMLTSGIPVTLTVIVGPTIVEQIVQYIPDWLSSGLDVAGGLLPALGIGLLLRYLPAKDYFGYLIIGFVAAVYLDIPILGVALAGAAFALILFKKNINSQQVQTVGGMDENE
ncbi:PTS mannose/fructose/sorbose/N-acetylgalactosamine transporter subunit IIC [Amphibacillus sp. Q70]|uniref:PTS mannose/fructose/sorbose/N-acetylgalactosamine transporter subunit IIC n=1 Tax=Amphibacillus sp. Q70 TaxID=3453416 RepID=UPI003F82A757